MNIFDLMGIVSRIPYEMIEKVEGVDVPKVQRLVTLYKQAEPHINALKPIEAEAQQIVDQLLPDIDVVLAALKTPPGQT